MTIGHKDRGLRKIRRCKLPSASTDITDLCPIKLDASEVNKVKNYIFLANKALPMTIIDTKGFNPRFFHYFVNTVFTASLPSSFRLSVIVRLATSLDL